MAVPQARVWFMITAQAYSIVGTRCACSMGSADGSKVMTDRHDVDGVLDVYNRLNSSRRGTMGRRDSSLDSKHEQLSWILVYSAHVHFPLMFAKNARGWFLSLYLSISEHAYPSQPRKLVQGLRFNGPTPLNKTS
eukprot:5787984-Pleurochrysis_carterae.AAC.10